MPAYSIEEYLQLPSPKQVWLWEGILPVGGAALLFAKQKVGKSLMILGLAEAIADPAIHSFLGQAISSHGNVLYVQLDTPRGLWIKGYISNVVRSEAARKNIYMLDREMDDMPVPFDIRTREAQVWVRSEVDRIAPVCVIFDTFKRMHRGDENDNSQMSIIYDIMVELSRPAAMMLLTHQTKAIVEGQDATARGASSVAGAVDCLIHMTKKRLKFEARSDIEEELKIFQQDDGTFTTHDAAEAVADYIDELELKGTKPSEIVKQLATRFQVSDRTARRWRRKD